MRSVKRNAEPQVVGLTPQTTRMTERTDTMKTYILRDPKAVEPQKPQHHARRPDPGVTATVAVICGPANPVPPAL